MAQVYSIIARLERSLAVAGDAGLIPAFCSRNMARMFIEKASMIRDKADPELNAAYCSRAGVPLHELQHLLLQISVLMLPDDLLSGVSVRRIVEVRRASSDKLEKMRDAVDRSVRNVLGPKFDTGFLRRAEDYVGRDLTPKLRRYRGEIQERLLDALGIASGAGAASVTHGLGLLHGINPLLLTVLTGVTFVSGRMLSKLPTLVRGQREDFKNTFAYFLEIPD